MGKSTVAARLPERLVEYSPVIIYGELNVEEIERFCETKRLCEAENDILMRHLRPTARVTKLLKYGLNGENRKICFALDNFEAYLEAQTNAKQVLRCSAAHPLMALLLSAIE